MKKTYKVAISGWAVVEVQADNQEAAQDFELVQQTKLGGELYGLEIHEAVLIDQAFKMHTDLN